MSTDKELGVVVETPEAEDVVIQTHEWYYLACHRSTGQDWFMMPHKTAADAVKSLAFYYKYNDDYETKVIRVRLPI